jgi:hypothetical protein
MAARLRHCLVAVAVVLATIALPAATGGVVACAGEGPHAGLVVDTGARVIDLCVTLDAAEVTGLRLIQLAATQHGLSYGFGLGGAAVCRLDGVGPTGNDCFAEYPEYWGYWHGDGRGGWTWASTGAGSHRVGDGDMEGWVWGTGDSGSSHRKPPPLAIDDVCESVTEPSPEPTRDPKPSASPTRDPKPTVSRSTETTSPAPGASSSPGTPRGGGSKERDRTGASSPTPSASEAPSSNDEGAPVLALGAPPPPGDEPPVGLFVAGLLAMLLGVGGWLRLRSRSKGAA